GGGGGGRGRAARGAGRRDDLEGRARPAVLRDLVLRVRGLEPADLAAPRQNSSIRASLGRRKDSANAAARSAAAMSTVRVTASGDVWPWSTSEKKMVASAATPMELPSCWIAFSVPDAEPTSCSLTPARMTLKN